MKSTHDCQLCGGTGKMIIYSPTVGPEYQEVDCISCHGQRSVIESMTSGETINSNPYHDQAGSHSQPAGINTAIKELVREIFGEDAANDKDIVSFYEEVNRTAMQDYVAQKDEANCFSLNEVMTMLADFAVLYYESKNKDIANDAAEYAWDEYKKKYREYPLLKDEAAIGIPSFDEKYKQLYPYCQICSRIAEEESPYCEITDCPHK